jgi:hypothetical protein
MSTPIIKTWTYNLINGSLTIDSSFGLRKISILLISGTGTYAGDLQAGVLQSQPLDLIIGTAVTIGDWQTIADGITLTTTGTIQIIAR